MVIRRKRGPRTLEVVVELVNLVRFGVGGKLSDGGEGCEAVSEIRGFDHTHGGMDQVGLTLH